MKTNYKVAIALVAGAAIGGAATQGLHAQAKPRAYVVAEVDVTNQDAFIKEYTPLAVKALTESGNKVVARGGKTATIEVPFPVHPHMLRHSNGYKLANDGHDTQSLAHYLGHRNLQSTARYKALAPDRFAKFWED